MVKDTTYYEYLELSPDACDSDIKNAFRKLAEEFPPDTNSERFNQVCEAYHVLSNLEKRQEYDETGKMEENFDSTQYYSEIFEEAQEQNVNVPPVRAPVSLSLDDSYFGCTKKVKYGRMVPDPTKSYVEGKIPHPDDLLKEENEVEITIPVGAAPGENQVLVGLGHNVPNYGVTDLVLIYVDEEEYDEKMNENESESDSGSFRSRSEGSGEDDDSDGSWQTEETLDTSDEEESEDSESEDEDRKYLFRRGENNELDLDMKINLKEYYVGVERSIKYFGDKNINFTFKGPIDTDAKYCLEGYGINGADMNVRFELELPDEIPEEYFGEFCSLMDKVCRNRCNEDFSKLDEKDVLTLVEMDDDEESEEEEPQDGGMQCAHQ